MSAYTVDFSSNAEKFLEGLVPNGISRRDHFAAMAMQSYITAFNIKEQHQVVNWAVNAADALIAELDKNGDKAE